MGAASATFLLPARERLMPRSLPDALGRWLARGDLAQMEGRAAERLFDVIPRGWPAAAVTRERDARDAGSSLWLRADPAWVRPDINGARLLAHGDAMRLAQADADALLSQLKPLFGDMGFLIDAPVPSRWYVQLPAGTPLPRFTSPADALGGDLFDHLPDDDVDGRSSEARRWRALLSETQIVLHNHPLNARRVGEGRSPVNSLWFWGAGTLPDRVHATFDAIHSADEVLHAFAARAGAAAGALPERWVARSGNGVFDLRDQRDPARLVDDWLVPATDALRSAQVDRLALDFGDAERWTLQRGHRWRIWRRPLRTLAADVNVGGARTP